MPIFRYDTINCDARYVLALKRITANDHPFLRFQQRNHRGGTVLNPVVAFSIPALRFLLGWPFVRILRLRNRKLKKRDQ